LQEQAQISHNAASEQMNLPTPPRNHPKPNAKKQPVPEQYVLPDSPTPFNGNSGHLHYASLDLSAGAVLKNNGHHVPDRPPKTNSSTSTPEKTKYAQINLHSHTPDKNSANNAMNHLQQSQTPYLTSNDDFLQQSAAHGYHPNGISQQQHYPQNQYQEQRQANDDICDSIRQYDMPIDQYDDDSYQLPVNSNYNDLYKAGRNNNQTDAFKQSSNNPTSSHPLNLNFNGGDHHGHFNNGHGHNGIIQKNVPEKYSRPERSNHSSESNLRHAKPVNGNGHANLPPLDVEEVPPRPPPPSKKQLQQLNHQLQHQQNSNVISNADDIDRIRTLRELGLPADEFFS
jgi:hypothetical protein